MLKVTESPSGHLDVRPCTCLSVLKERATVAADLSPPWSTHSRAVASMSAWVVALPPPPHTHPRAPPAHPPSHPTFPPCSVHPSQAAGSHISSACSDLGHWSTCFPSPPLCAQPSSWRHWHKQGSHLHQTHRPPEVQGWAGRKLRGPCVSRVAFLEEETAKDEKDQSGRVFQGARALGAGCWYCAPVPLGILLKCRLQAPAQDATFPAGLPGDHAAGWMALEE